MKNESDLGLIVFDSIKDFGCNVDKHIQTMRNETKSYIAKVKEDTFSSGESKVTLLDSIRGKDIFILQDVCNSGKTYNLRGNINHFSPNDYFKQIKDVIGAINGHAKRITVIMPYLIDGRQHRRNSREPLACAMDLQDLINSGVDDIVTIEAHDPGVKNAIPTNSLENIHPTNTILKEFVINEQKNIDFNNLVVIAPDLGASERARYYADMLKSKLGVFEKRRDFSQLVNGKNPIIAHDYLGPDLTNQDVLVIDDMISSGGSIIEVAEQAQKKGAKHIYFIVSFALFTEGIESFKEAHEKKLFEKIYTTNTTYLNPEYRKEGWIVEVDCSKLLANVIHRLNKNLELSPVLTEKENVLQYVKTTND